MQQFSLQQLILLFIFFLFPSTELKAQITPDQTLGQESSVVKPIDAIKDRIEGGATRGSNLFHSFQEFNIGENRIVNFANPVNIENILTRVTGNNISNIFGKLGVEGTANLFLINPNGIFFGNNASLDIRGSFTATTADGIKLGETGLFTATNPQHSNLLSVQPGALFTNALRNYQAQINNQGNLTVGESKNITFFSANVINTGTLTAPEGNIQLVGTENLIVRGNLNTNTLLLDTKNLTIAEDNNATIDKTTLEGLSGNTNLIFQAINDITIHPLSDKSLSLADGIGKIIFTADADGNGVGNFQMNTADTIRSNGQSVEIKGVNLNIGNINTSSELGGGNIALTATSGNIITQNLNSSSDSDSGTGGNGGAITLSAGGDITTQSLKTFSFDGDGGNITLTATSGNITTQYLDSSSSSYSDSGTAGNGGAITLSAGGDIFTQFLDSSSSSYSDSGTAGNGGAITLSAGGDISTQNLFSYSSSDSFEGTGGNGGAITLSAGGNISTQNLFSSSFLFEGTGGNGGAITLSAGGDISTQYLSSFSSLEDGGAITLTAGGDITTQHLNSNSFSDSFEGTGGNGGAITLSAGGDISTQYLSSLSSSDSFEGTGGNGGAITLSAGGDISTQYLFSFSSSFEGTGGNGGAITLSAGGDISTQNLDSYSYSSSGTAGNGGAITLSAGGDIKGIRDEDKKIPVFSSFSVSETGTSGQGGNVTLAAKNKITNLEILTLSSSSKSGDVQVNGLGDLSLTNIDIITSKQVTINNLFLERITLDVGKEGQSGNVNITSNGNLTFKDSRIESDTRGSDPAGNVTITSPGTVRFSNSQISSKTSSTGNAGNIEIDANNLTLTNASEISASTTGVAKAGNITLNVKDNITLNGTKTGVFANTAKGATGDSGSIEIDPKTLLIKNGAGIGVNSQGSGEGGDIYLQAGTLSLDNKSFITAETVSNQGGNINLDIQNLFLLRNNSRITATAGAGGNEGNGGNIKINSPFIIAFPKENSDITANAFQGNGGKINITTNAIFGLKLRPQLTPRSDITASSQFGLAGQIQINTPDVDPTSGLIELPGNLVDAESLVGKGICSYEQRSKNNSFVITGKGGVPADSDEYISNSPGLVEWATRSKKQERTSLVMRQQERLNNQPQNSTKRVIQQAQGWLIGADGKIILTAEAPNVTPQISALNHPDCHATRTN